MLFYILFTLNIINNRRKQKFDPYNNYLLIFPVKNHPYYYVKLTQ